MREEEKEKEEEVGGGGEGGGGGSRQFIAYASPWRRVCNIIVTRVTLLVSKVEAAAARATRGMTTVHTHRGRRATERRGEQG